MTLSSNIADKPTNKSKYKKMASEILLPENRQIIELLEEFSVLTDTCTVKQLQTFFKQFFNYTPCKQLSGDTKKTRMIVLTEIIQQLTYNKLMSQSQIRTYLQTLQLSKNTI